MSVEMFLKKMHFSVSLLQFLESCVFFPFPPPLGYLWFFPFFHPFFFTLLAITPYLSPLYPYLFHLLIPSLLSIVSLSSDTFLFPPFTALLLSYVSFVQVWAASSMSITCWFYCLFLNCFFVVVFCFICLIFAQSNVVEWVFKTFMYL